MYLSLNFHKVYKQERTVNLFGFVLIPLKERYQKYSGAHAAIVHLRPILD